jgi:hypothetical protein
MITEEFSISLIKDFRWATGAEAMPCLALIGSQSRIILRWNTQQLTALCRWVSAEQTLVVYLYKKKIGWLGIYASKGMHAFV